MATAIFVSLCLSLAVVPQSLAQDREEESPGELALEGVDRLMRALEVLIQMIPQYEMPVIDENGDIIIRRKRRPDELEFEDPDYDDTRT